MPAAISSGSYVEYRPTYSMIEETGVSLMHKLEAQTVNVLYDHN